MKIRPGFVSNSSTTSFCIYGVHTEEDVWDEAENVGLECHRFNYSGYAVGMPFCDMGEDETKADFKTRVQALVKKVLPDATEFGMQEDSYYDG